ncbi:hypothetical protein DSO57_1033748 [Entomophthora muscae]|uniref:Uncharacterized protein n=1 Tax=Entomophthora muscae TaxID=34485 RepID=A0ACC2S287_9FUNG|nr:hypothetical protein DSO57_1033748 [Entomophthora muscae]
MNFSLTFILSVTVALPLNKVPQFAQPLDHFYGGELSAIQYISHSSYSDLGISSIKPRKATTLERFSTGSNNLLRKISSFFFKW